MDFRTEIRRVPSTRHHREWPQSVGLSEWTSIQLFYRPSPSDIRIKVRRENDGEIVCLDDAGRPQFRDLLFHRAEPCFYAFDLLMRDGKDLRREGLIERKHELRRLLSALPVSSQLRYADHLEHHGTALFQRVCEMDLEGIVARHSSGPYVTDRERSTWFKIRNRSYSQMQGREELFGRERHKEPVSGWHCCELACAELEQANV